MFHVTSSKTASELSQVGMIFYMVLASKNKKINSYWKAITKTYSIKEWVNFVLSNKVFQMQILPKLD
jgi:hypothetical protein